MKMLLKTLILLFFVSSLNLNVKADEGMWLPLLLNNNYAQMKKLGLKLTSEQLYSMNHSSLKDAIVWFGAGCTGEVVSAKGLVLTNHHCGFSAIASLSTTKDNILDSGFWAKSYADERPAPGLSVSFVVRIEEITVEVLDSLKNLSEKDRIKRLPSVYKSIVERATRGTHYEAQCREMFKGNSYYLFVFEKFTDIRLVGTPPQSIGKFGGETDNWMWPRHTGDFSMFRIYCGKDGKPAKYSTENIPYSPKHFLPISEKGYAKNDFAMIMGFPGRTNRYEFSQGVQIATDKVDPAIVALRDVRLNAWKEQMDKNAEVRLKLISNFAGVANYWKFYRGESEQLRNNKVYDQKLKEEAQFIKWSSGKPEYSTLWANVAKAYANYTPYCLQSTYLNEGILSPFISRMAYYALIVEETMAKGDEKATERIRKQYAGIIDDMTYTDAVVTADKRIFDSLLVLNYNNIPKDQQPKYLADIISKYDASNPREAIRSFTNDVFSGSVFTDIEMAKAWFRNPRPGVLKNDPVYQFVKAFRTHYLDNYKPKYDEFQEQTAMLGRLYMKGLLEMNKEKQMYPDANSSIRLTYGTCRPYMKFAMITNLDEVIEKNIKNKGNPEFDVPQRLIDLQKAKDYGPYAMKDGKLPVAFLTDNDITGGNSGSPVMDGEGRMIGLAFDGNWEAMSGNIHFDPDKQRTICVDIRYVLFLIDKYGKAGNIISEMNIVK
ncbi:MAG: S46 family peptidase [Bacteroidia bacterium]